MRSIFAYVLFGFHDIVIRVWLPRARAGQSDDEQLQEFLDQLSEELQNASLDSLEALSAKSLRHFAFQDDQAHLVEPDIEVIDWYEDAVLERAERYFAERDLDCAADAEQCAKRNMLADLKEYIDEHTESTITFLVTVTCGDAPTPRELRLMGAALANHLQELTVEHEAPLQQLSLYMCAGFAHYLVMGRIMKGRDFHSLHTRLIAPINGLLAEEPTWRARTVTHLVAQRGLLIAEERLTGLGRSDFSPVWSSHEVSPEAALETPLADAGYDDGNGAPVIGGRFRVVDELSASRIGVGGTSEVFRVHDTFADVDRALKLFRAPHGQAAFLEANYLRNCDHPGIVQYIRLGEHEDNYYVVMEYVDGQNLRQYINEHGPLDPQPAVKMICHVLDALAHVHPDEYRREQLRALAEERPLSRDEADEMMSLMNRGIIHRDIKPENIMIRPADGTIVLVDFGIASPAGRHTGTLSGTRGYMAPDAGIDGWRPEDDIFACGVVLYELLSGHLPYQADDEDEVGSPIDIRQRRDDISDALAESIMRACAPNRAMRFDSARGFAEALEPADSDQQNN